MRWAVAFILACLLSPPVTPATLPWRAGTGKVKITPRGSLWMAGYGSRTKPSEGVYQDLYVRALALQDPAGRRAVLVASDLLGFPAEFSARVAARAQKQYQLPRDRLLLSSSHTHGGPVVDRMLWLMHDLTPKQRAAVDAYARELEGNVLTVIGMALRDLQPAALSVAHTEAHFGVNRRVKTDHGIEGGVNKAGPVDPDVPVLLVEGKNGKLRAVVLSYACHNTTARDFMQFHGDYAGFAEAWLETQHPGAVALFMSGCGADINPAPRGSIDLARQYGEELAKAIEGTTQKPRSPLQPPLRSAFTLVPVAFAPPPSREALQARLQDKDVYVRRHAAAMLNILDRDGRLPTSYPYPLQVWQFGQGMTLVALAGEVVVDYALRLKKELGTESVWVAGYCNDVFAYIPSRRVLEEGGYEGGEAMKYYGQPGPFAPTVEETIVKKVHDVANQLRAQTATRTNHK